MLPKGSLVRMTRAQHQERTHDRLLEAGRLVFLRRGFLTATVEEIAAAAGYTRGAVYKHFGGKHGLWLAIVEARAQALLALTRAALERASSRAELLVVLNPDAVNHGEDEARWAMVMAEALAAEAAQPQHAAAIAAIQRRLDNDVAAALATHCARLGLHPAIPPRRFVVAWGAMGAGLVLRRAVDPETEASAVLASVLEILFPPGTEVPS